MARLKRLCVAGHAHHVRVQSVSGTPAFRDAVDHLAFLDAVQRAMRDAGVELHAYALMVDEVQLIVTPALPISLGRAMQSLARHYVAGFNRRHGRTGALWQGRYQAAPVEAEPYLLTCMRYVEQAPVRHRLVTRAIDHPWSSAAHHAGMASNTMLSGVPAGSDYWRLGNTPFEREAAYRTMLDQAVAPADAARIEATTFRGWALGNSEYVQLISQAGARRASARPRGRPNRN